MNLGVRCQKMLFNGCQCPNDAAKNSTMCLLHLDDVLAKKVENTEDGKNE